MTAAKKPRVITPKPCTQCRIMVVNNVVVHELGCPIAYRKRQK